MASEGAETEASDRDSVLREVLHRVKNDMHLMALLTRMAVASASDERWRAEAEALSARIEAISRVHRWLGQGATDVRFDELAREQVGALEDAHAPPFVRVELRIEPCRVPLAQASVLALILNEAVTNALRHAFVGRDDGTVVVELGNEGDALVLTVADDGRGFDPDAVRHGVGLELLNGLAGQVGAALELRSDQGTTVRVTLAAPER